MIKNLCRKGIVLKSTFLASLFLLQIFSACVWQDNKLVVTGLKSAVSGPSVQVSAVQINSSQDKIIISGANLDKVTQLQIQTKEAWTLSFDSQSSSQIVASILNVSASALNFALETSYNLLISTAYATTPVIVTFTLPNNSVTTNHIVNGTIAAVDLATMGAVSGQFLQFNGINWSPASIATGLTYKGTWNASTDAPNLSVTNDCGGAIVSGEYYIVDTNGATNVDGIFSWTKGDWIVCSSSGSYQKIVGAAPVLALDDITNVSATTPVVGDLLQYNGANWTNAQLAINQLSDVDTVSSPPTLNQVLKWDGANWTPQADALGSGAVASVNTQSGIVTLDTDDITEGVTNYYFTQARARNSMSAGNGISYVAGTGVISANFGTALNTVAQGNHTHADATLVTAGFMSATDKTKLDNLPTDAIQDADFTTNGFMKRTAAGAYTTVSTVAPADITACANGEILKVAGGVFSCGTDLSSSSAQVENYIADDVTTGFIPYDDGTKLTTSGLFWDNTNSHLGIGTTTPTHSLTIQKNAGGAFINLQNTSASTGAAGQTGITFRRTTTGAGASANTEMAAITEQVTDLNHATRTADLVFENINNGSFAASPNMIIKGSGNVGIGTNAPARKLHLFQDSTDSSRIRLERDSNANASGVGTIEFYGKDSAANIQQYGYITGGIKTNTNGAEDGQFNIATMVNGTITDVLNVVGGNVGINTTNPLNVFQVSGNIGQYSNYGTSGGTPVGSSLYLGDNNFIGAGYYNSAPGLSAVFDSSAGVAASLGFYTYTGAMNSRTERMRITSAGRIGIGTNSPSDTLHVVGSAKISTILNGCVTADATGVLSSTGSACGTGSSTVSSVSGTAPLVVTNGTTTPLISMAAATTSVDGYLTSTDWTTFNNKLTSVLNSGYMFVGNGSNVATAVLMSGDTTIATSGAVTISNNAVTTNKIINGAVTNTKLAGLSAANCFIGETPRADGAGSFYCGSTGDDTTGAIGQWTLNSGNIYRSSGNVGIGATPTVGKLHITNSNSVGLYMNGNTSAQSASDLYIARSSSASTVTNGPNIRFDDGTSNNANLIQNSQGSLAFWNYGAGAWNERMRISSTGNVGIGTTTPKANLQVGDASAIFKTLSGATENSWVGRNVHYDGTNFKRLVADNETPILGFNGNGGFYFDVATDAGNTVDSIITLATVALFDKSGNISLGGTTAGTTPSMYIQASSDRVGIGTTAPLAKLHISAAGDGATGLLNIYSTSAGADGAMARVGEYTFLNQDSPGHFLMNWGARYDGVANQWVRTYTSTNNYLPYIKLGTNNNVTIGGASSNLTTDANPVFSDLFTVNVTTGNVGIGTTVPAAITHISSALNQTNADDPNQILFLENTQADAAGLLTGIRFRQSNGTNAANSFIGFLSSGTNTTRGNFVIATPNTSGNAIGRMSIDSSGNVGIGTSAPTSPLTVFGPSYQFAGYRGNMQSLDTTTMAAGVGSGMFLGGQYTAGGYAEWAGFSSIKANATSGDAGAHLIFATRPTGAAGGTITNERLRIASDGNVGIGTTIPGRELHISSTSGSQIKLQGTTGSWNGLEFLSTSYDAYMGMLEADGRFFIDVDSNGEDFTILQNGNVGIGTTAPAEKLDLGGGNIKMGYELITVSHAGGTWTAGWKYATCTAGKYATGGACTSSSGTAPTNTDITGTSFGCYLPAGYEAQNYQIKVICMNVR